MRNKLIKKTIKSDGLLPNLQDYDSFCTSFNWENIAKELDGLPQDKGLNIAYEAVDRHALDHKANKIALRFIGKSNETKDFTFQNLKDLSNQFANVLKKLGIGKEDRIFTLTGRIPELYFTALGTWKNRSIFCPLFSVFGPEPIQSRLSIGSGKVLITTKERLL